MNAGDQYRMLFDFYSHMGFEGRDFLRECLSFDYLLQGRNPSVPDFLKPKVHINRESLKKFLLDSSNIEKYLPDHAGEDSKKIASNIYGRVFSFDIPSFLRDGIIIDREVTILFDYSEKGRGANKKYALIPKC